MNSSDTVHQIQFILWGVCGTCICCTGVVGNLIALSVLLHKNMRRSPSTVYIAALTICDVFILLVFFFSFSLTSIYGSLINQTFIERVVYPVGLIFQTCAVYLIVSFTVERFLAIKYPFKNLSYSVKKATKIVFLILLLSFLYNSPRLFESIQIGTNPETNQTLLFRDHPTYQKIYYYILYPPVMFILPFIVLTILNFWLLVTVKSSWNIRTAQRKKTAKRAGVNDCNNSRNIIQSGREKNLTFMIVCIVFTFLTCQFLPMIDNILTAYIDRHHLNSKEYYIFFSVASEFVALNSAVNFILYSLIGRKFRQTLFIIYCRKWRISRAMAFDCQTEIHRYIRKSEEPAAETLIQD